METLEETARVLTSRPVRRAVVHTTLLTTGAVALFGLAAIASALFFQNFVPDQVLTTPVHLQYGSSAHPYGITSLGSPMMKSAQDYDISVTLSIPRSVPNTERGNFMVSLHLLDADVSPQLHDAARTFATQHDSFSSASILFSSRRAAIVPYIDPIISLASRILFIFWHLLMPNSQNHDLRVHLAEHVSFGKHAALPKAAYVEVEAGQTIQIYKVALHLTAQLRGLRWLMFHYRLPTYLVFTTLFWACEVFFMGFAWIFWSTMGSGSSSGSQGKSGKGGSLLLTDEDDADHSDHLLSASSYARPASLKQEPSIKREESQQERLLSELPMGGAEADDEDEGEDYKARILAGDAGRGTGYGHEGSVSVRRRGSRSLAE